MRVEDAVGIAQVDREGLAVVAVADPTNAAFPGDSEGASAELATGAAKGDVVHARQHTEIASCNHAPASPCAS